MDDHGDRAGEVALREELERYRTLVEAVGDVMYALDESGHISLVNEGPVERLGHSREELLGTHVREVLPASAVERGTECIADLLADPERTRGRFEFRATRPDGETRLYEDRLAVLTDEDGDYAGSVGVIRDITEERQRQEELRRQNERLEEFAGVMSHDLRNPLQVARGYLDEAERTGETEAFERVRRAHDRMRTIIDDVLTLAREGETVRETTPTDLESIARDAWRTVGTEGTTLSVVGTIEIEAAPDRLQTLLENLFRNAVEHGSTGDRTESDDGEGGPTDGSEATDRSEHEADSITVTVGPIETMPTTTRLTSDAVQGFYVADDGPGIPEDEREAVFESGYSTAAEGTGFGLAIVEQIAEAHGWEVTLTESRDGGARFEFTTAHADTPL